MQNKKIHNTYTHTIYSLLITQLSDNDAVLLEIVIGNTRFFAASIYLDYNEPIENNIKSLEKVLKNYQRSKNYYSYG